MVAHLLNIDDGLAATVAEKLGLDEMPEAAEAAVATRMDLEASQALSILRNGPDSFAGRRVGALVSDGCDPIHLAALKDALEAEGATLEVVAPAVGGVTATDGSHMPARYMIGGGPSVLFDAVALIADAATADRLGEVPAVRDFVADAFSHCKVIAFNPGASSLLMKANVDPDADEGLIRLDDADAIVRFVEQCRKLRVWGRERKLWG